MQAFFLFIFSFFLFAPLFANSLTDNIIFLQSENDLLLVGKKTYFLEDTNGNLTIEDILKLDSENKFQLNNQDIFLRKPTQSTFWLKLNIKNQSGKDSWLELGSTYLWYIDYYAKKSEKFELITKTGILRPESNKAFPSELFWLPIGMDTNTKTIYIRIQTLRPIELPIQIGTIRSLNTNHNHRQYILTVFVGLMFAMFIYNLFLLFATKDKLYILYLCYIFTSLPSALYSNNYPYFLAIFNEEIKNHLLSHPFVWINISFCFVGLFSIHFLKLNRRPFLKRILQTFILFYLIILPLLDFFEILQHNLLVSIYQPITSIFMLTLFGTSLYIWIKANDKYARFYLIAWIWIILGVISYFLTINGIIEYNLLNRNSILFGIGLETIFFSLALADRINSMRFEKESAQNTLLLFTQEQNQILEKKIQEKTEDLIHTSQMLEMTNDIALVGGWEFQLVSKKIIWSSVTKKIHEVTLDYLPQLETAINFYKSGNSRDLISEAVNKCINDGTGYELELQLITAKGKEIWVRTIGQADFENGICKRIFGTFQDITTEKLFLEEIQNLNKFQNIILDGNDYSIISTTPDGTFKTFNKGAEKMLGYQANEVIGISTPAILHDLDEVILRAEILSKEFNTKIEPGFEVFVAKSKLGKADTNEWTYIKKDKSRITVELSVTTLRDKNGEVTGFLGIAKDITESKKARLELIQTKEQVEAINQALVSFKLALDEHALVSITDTKGKITYVNEKFCKVSQYLPHELIGKDHRIISSGYHDKTFFKDLWETIQNKSVWKGEIKNRTKNGSYYWVNSTIIGFLDVEGNLNQFIAIRTDITESKKLEEELTRAKEQAEAANLAKSEFLANMTHELRTPLNGVIGFADILIKTKLDEEQKMYMATVHRSATSLLDLINDILDFSKIEAGKLELELVEVDLQNLLAQVIDIARYKAEEKSLHITLDLAENAPRFLWTDPIRLRQILVNLLGNAIKFTEEGQVEIKVEILDTNENEKQTKFLFSVKDTGIGISEENQKRIFQSFTQADSSTSRKYGGTGLGLSISNQLLALMNSKLELKAELGKGSTFYFNLWANTRLETENKKIEELEEAKNISDIFDQNQEIFKILTADDNPINQLLMKSILRQILPNAIIFEANNGQVALEIFQAENPDIIFMDIQMPEMNGYESTKAIRKFEKESSIPIIALTAGTVKGERERCESAGMNDYLTKPIVKSSIESTILKWLLGKNSYQEKKETKPTEVSYLHYNENMLKERLDGDEEFLLQLMARVKSDIDSDFSKLKEGFMEKNLSKVTSTAHKIKGTALTLCFEYLAYLTLTLESQEYFEEEIIEKLMNQIEGEIELLLTLMPN